MGAGWGSATSHQPSTIPKSLSTSSSLTCHLFPLPLKAFIRPSVSPSSPSSSSPSPKSVSSWDEAALVLLWLSPTPWAPARSQRGGDRASPARLEGNPHPHAARVTSGQGMGWTARETPDPAGVPGEASRQSVPWLLFQARGRIGIRSHPLVPGLWLHQPCGD